MNNNGYNNSGSGSNFNQFTTNQSRSSPQGTTKEFLESNSLIAKVAFLLIVIFAFVILLRLGIYIMTRFLGPQDSPHIIDGMVDAKQAIIIPQDPATSGAKTISRSDNENSGIEFTWSIWIYIDGVDLDYNKNGQYKHIFHKGNDTFQSNGLNFPNNAPGLYLAPNSNTLAVMMNTYNVINEEVIIPDIPINKWVNVIMRCKNTTFDVYINGTITRSIHLMGVPKQNYGDVYVAANGGFTGYISNLWYYNHALGSAEIQRLVRAGPNLKFSGNDAMNMKNPNYLSLRWYFYGAQDGFNPGPNRV